MKDYRTIFCASGLVQEFRSLTYFLFVFTGKLQILWLIALSKYFALMLTINSAAQEGSMLFSETAFVTHILKAPLCLSHAWKR